MSARDDKNDFYWKLLQRQVQEERIEKVFRAFDRQGIETILIKGWAAARNYPQPFDRLAVDIDAAVRPSSFAACEKLLKDERILGVDLHKGLRRHDTLAWDDLYGASESVTIGGARVNILCAEDHLRVLCVHWLNDGGADKERLYDIYYAVKNRPAAFDWTRCLDAAGARRRKWIVCAIGLAEKYLGLDIEDTPVAVEAKNLPAWLVKTVEREWKNKVRLKPLHQCLRNGKELLEQIQLRVPPNPVQATVEVEGDFNGRTRIPHQVGSILLRLKPSLKRISRTMRQHFDERQQNRHSDRNRQSKRAK